MKKHTNLPAVALMIALLLVSCKKDSVAPAAVTGITVAPGNWIVSSYTQKAENKTAAFSGVLFTFNEGGVLSVVDGSKTISGSWSSTKGGITYYGGPPSTATFTISLGTTTPYDKISKVWNVALQDATTIQLDNKEPLEDEHLTFTKN